MEVFHRIVDKVASLVPPPDYSARGPSPVVGLDGFEVTGWNRGTSLPSLEHARRLAEALQPIVKGQGCTMSIETAVTVLPAHSYRQGAKVWQLVVSPGEGQSVGAFGFSLQAIAEALEDPSGFAHGQDEAELQVFIPRFSQAIRSAVAANKHDKL